ncbi:MAG: polysaccharide deacetylase family protein [Acidobacteria bacterium]|nr:polysaccharide deacetylase family protein [Acidobacteriota bacterium]MBV9476136.1 polysaccharide deacetylase family protein [Acidobacteriota bacterium]
MKRLLLLIALAASAAHVCAAPAAESRRIAVTLDDLPLAQIDRYSAEQQEDLTRRVLATLQKHQVKAVAFVNESKLEVDGKVDARRLHLLDEWLAAGQELGNHGYAHLDLHTVDPDLWLADVLRGERQIKPLAAAHGSSVRWFRHPFLHLGRSPEIQQRTAAFLAEHGYRIAPVTIDNEEWIYAAAYADASARGDRLRTASLGEDYVRYMLTMIDFYEAQSRAIAGELIPQTLLIHANELNADWLDALLTALEGRGYQWVHAG